MKYTMVRDGRTLRALINAGFIKEAKYGDFPQIDTIDSYWDKMAIKNQFEHNGNTYKVNYSDGSFFPFVFKVA